MRNLFGMALTAVAVVLFSCSTAQKISKTTANTLLKDSSVLNAHLGISLYDAEAGKYLYNYQGDKYFVPASNTKLFTCFAGMKYLGDSLVGMRYTIAQSQINNQKVLCLAPTGDPTFLHEDFKNNPVYKLLQDSINNYDAIGIHDTSWRENVLGYGWAWDDYNDDYMVERSVMPVYGNTLNISLRSIEQRDLDLTVYQAAADGRRGPPTAPGVNYLKTIPGYFDSAVNADKSTLAHFMINEKGKSVIPKLRIERERTENKFNILSAEKKFTGVNIPFATVDNAGYDILPRKSYVAAHILSHLLQKKEMRIAAASQTGDKMNIYNDAFVHPFVYTSSGWKTIKSQPTDSMLKPMMHRSDNFFAEQTLLMVSNEKLGYMKDADIIDALLKTDLKDLPQRPKWVDGSGLSRYNLFTPQSIIQLLVKMKTEFGMERLKNILATGGEGTLGNYYQNLKGKIFAKTGTLSNNCALSGFLITKKGKLFIFSILANNYQTGASPVRRAVEKWLNHIYNNN
jgi:serine-type D-Ala-D-Ala carboxypeptidase/endopeptidase (penicillin-binding protein 4)